MHTRPDLRCGRRLTLAAGVAAALFAGTVHADANRGMQPPRNVVEYQLDLDQMQLELDREQEKLDQMQADLDRRKHRFREKLEDVSWRFKQLDTNEDFRISEEEASVMPRVARMFASLDDDGNGVLTRAEFDDLALDRLRSRRQ